MTIDIVLGAGVGGDEVGSGCVMDAAAGVHGFEVERDREHRLAHTRPSACSDGVEPDAAEPERLQSQRRECLRPLPRFCRVNDYSPYVPTGEKGA